MKRRFLCRGWTPGRDKPLRIRRSAELGVSWRGEVSEDVRGDVHEQVLNHVLRPLETLAGVAAAAAAAAAGTVSHPGRGRRVWQHVPPVGPRLCQPEWSRSWQQRTGRRVGLPLTGPARLWRAVTCSGRVPQKPFGTTDQARLFVAAVWLQAGADTAFCRCAGAQQP